MKNKPLIVSYGGGTNSTALLVGMHERGIVPTAITFADTGGEKLHTYCHIQSVSRWCESVSFPSVTILRGREYWLPQQVKDGGLYEESFRLGTLPSKAYGHGNCSLKWKFDPQVKWMRSFCKETGIPIHQITRVVGFDADEPERAERAEILNEKHRSKRPWKEVFPLVQWQWGREACIAAIARSGLPQPGKSACYFCPSMKKVEILELREMYPDLFEKAIAMERKALAGEGQAPATTSKGLGRYFSWEQFVKEVDQYGTPLKQIHMFMQEKIIDIGCECYDGD